MADAEPAFPKAPGGLDFVAAEDIVFFAARALCATEATNQKDRDSGGDNQRQKASARDEPVYKTIHKLNPTKRALKT